MTRCILENKGKDSPSKTGSSVLSPKEVEILVHVAVGFKNQEIADKLCISPNTLNTHLYNVYKKINVPNRLQAILWAAKNL
jgi:LuxR family transcriptional regulator of csgAB operon